MSMVSESIKFKIADTHYEVCDAETAINLVIRHFENRFDQLLKEKIEAIPPTSDVPFDTAACQCEKPWPVIARTRCMTCNLPLRKDL